MNEGATIAEAPRKIGRAARRGLHDGELQAKSWQAGYEAGKLSADRNPAGKPAPAPPIRPRLFRRPELRIYLAGMTDAEIAGLIARGRLPAPIWGAAADDARARWDRHAVDRALDHENEIPSTTSKAVRELDRSLGIETPDDRPARSRRRSSAT